jgi:hypothetical protein
VFLDAMAVSGHDPDHSIEEDCYITFGFSRLGLGQICVALALILVPSPTQIFRERNKICLICYPAGLSGVPSLGNDQNMALFEEISEAVKKSSRAKGGRVPPERRNRSVC